MEPLTREQRISPQIQAIDSNVARTMANAGYSNISVPPGVAIQRPQQVQQPQLNPASPNQHIEPNYTVPVANLLAGQQQQQAQAQQVQQPQQSIVGRGSPLAAYKLEQQRQQQMQQQPQEPQNKVQFVTGSDGTISIQPQTQQQQQPANQQQQGTTPAELLAAQQQQLPPQQAQNIQPQQQVDNSDALKQEIDRLKMESDSMKQILANGLNVPRQEATQQKNDFSSDAPKLSDFIKDLGDDWNQEEALNPHTPSGIAYCKWVDARDAYKSEQVKKSILTSLEQKKQQETTQQKINALASQHKEFQDLYGRPDVNKIQDFWNNLISSDWGKLKQALDAVNGSGQKTGNMNDSMSQMIAPANQAQPANGLQNRMEVNPNLINSQANQIVPIHSGSSGASVQNNIQIPESIQAMQRIFGSNFELPRNAIIG